MAIDINTEMEEYKRSASAAAGKLVRKYIARTDKLAKASSDEAQANFVSAMADSEVLARRQSRLRRLNESDLNDGMKKKGQAAYSSGVSAGAKKWAKNVQPYRQEQETIKAGLPPKTRDGITNVDQRLKPFVTGMQNKKKELD